MIVYHGSAIEVSSPDVYHSRDNVDFGKGFYITPFKDQASKWAARFKRHQGKGIVSLIFLAVYAIGHFYFEIWNPSVIISELFIAIAITVGINFRYRLRVMNMPFDNN